MTDIAHIPVLLYHSISEKPVRDIAPFAIDPERFDEHLAVIAASGRSACTFSELIKRLDDPATARDSVCITFDDGWADNIKAAEQLAAHGLPATIYVTSGYLDQPAKLTSGQLRELHGAPGIEIGAHSVNHPHLDELPTVEAVREIAVSKHVIEDVIGERVASFAYPHGAYDRRVRQAVIDAGFDSAAAVKNALSHAGDDRFALARWTITSDSDADDIGRVLAGSGVPVAWSGERLRTRTYRMVRRMRRRIRI